MEAEEYERLWGKIEWNDPDISRAKNQELKAWVTTIYQRSEIGRLEKSQAIKDKPAEEYNPADVGVRLEEFQQKEAILDIPYAALKVCWNI